MPEEERRAAEQSARISLMVKAWCRAYNVAHMQGSRDQAGAEAALWGDEGVLDGKRNGKMTFWLLQVAGWGGLGMLIFVVRSAGLMPDLLPVSGTLSFLVLGFLVTSAFRSICRRVFDWRKPPPVMALLAAGLAVAIVAVNEGSAMLVCHVFYGDAFFYSRPLRGAGVINHLLVIGCWLASYFLIKQKRIMQALERENRKSELKLLRYQVNPHFLFNALNSIAAHARSPEKVTLGIEALADYLRFSLDQDKMTHPLGEELAAMDNYLTVEKIRFEEKLSYVIETDGNARRHPTPPAIVQPLVENAIKYGAPAASGALEIRISATLASREIRVAVENSGPWISGTRRNSPETGLSNLRNRLNLIYGVRATLTVEKNEDRVRVTLKIPADANR